MQDPNEFDPPAGVAITLGPDLRRILAPNPMPMTFRGTNTYLLGQRKLAVIDPGPDDDAHLAAILQALGPAQSISHILVTHSHLDHSALAPRLAGVTGAPVLAYGDSRAGRSAIMAALEGADVIHGSEGVDHGFAPDLCLQDNDEIAGDGWSLRALWTPGHMGNHMCFVYQDEVFTGDLVMGWASSMVSPPDGDLTDFMASCRRLADIPARRYHPGHGAAVDHPHERVNWLIDHRLSREAQILDRLGPTGQTVEALTRQIYQDVSPGLLRAASRNVLAHLIDLYGQKRVECDGPLSETAKFSRA